MSVDLVSVPNVILSRPDVLMPDKLLSIPDPVLSRDNPDMALTKSFSLLEAKYAGLTPAAKPPSCCC